VVVSVDGMESNEPIRGVSYSTIRDRIMRLLEAKRAAGVDFHDMTMVFEDVEKPLYYDSMCHFNAEGNEILARRIAPIIIEAFRKNSETSK
jgi:hypothetical protein